MLPEKGTHKKPGEVKFLPLEYPSHMSSGAATFPSVLQLLFLESATGIQREER